AECRAREPASGPVDPVPASYGQRPAHQGARRRMELILGLRARAWMAAVICGAAAACSGPPPSYPEQIAAWHAEKDRFMRESSESPVPEGQRGSFAPLPYFSVDPAYRVPAMLQVAAQGPA